MRDTLLLDWPSVFVACLCVVASSFGCYTLGFVLGLRRGREVERMEPPRDGQWHFRDCPIRVFHAANGVAAIESVLAASIVRPKPFAAGARGESDG